MYRKLWLTIRFFTTKRVMSEAAALTYSTLLAIVPILAVVFAIARGFGYNKYIEMWFRDALSSQPQAAEVIIGLCPLGAASSCKPTERGLPARVDEGLSSNATRPGLMRRRVERLNHGVTHGLDK